MKIIDGIFCAMAGMFVTIGIFLLILPYFNIFEELIKINSLLGIPLMLISGVIFALSLIQQGDKK